MTDKINIWICVQSREVCPSIHYMFMEPWGTARNRKAWSLPPRAEMLRPAVHQNHPGSSLKTFPGSHPETPKRIS